MALDGLYGSDLGENDGPHERGDKVSEQTKVKDRWQFNLPDHGDDMCSECGGCTQRGCRAHERCETNGLHD